MEFSDATPGKYGLWATLSFLMIFLRYLILDWWDSPNGAISKFGILRAWLWKIGMHWPFLTSFASFLGSIVARSPDADFWLPFKSRWRKLVMRVFPWMGMVWYSVPLQMFSWIIFQFGRLPSIVSSWSIGLNWELIDVGDNRWSFKSLCKSKLFSCRIP